MMMQKQSGATLLVALIILLMITLIGVSSLKSGLFHERMAFNTQSDEMAFQAAESAISGVISMARHDGVLLTRIMDGGATRTMHCVSAENGMLEGTCNGETLDVRDSLQAEAGSLFETRKSLRGTDAVSFMDYQFSTQGEGRFVSASMPFSAINDQKWRKVGPGAGPFSDDLGLVDYTNQ